MAIILFADNDSNFLKTRKEYLEQEGYCVVPASTPLEAKRLLEQGRVDLAILDIRLKNDDDEKDISGLILAQQVALSIPKIIMTGFPSVQAVREALGPTIDGLPPAVDFIAKSEGPNALLEAICEALAKIPTSVQDIFIVHGHDEAARETVARFIERLGLRPIVLREQPFSGRAIIDQIEHYSRVGFAVAILTPDDIGYQKDKPDQKKYRARQNVVFELGFFIGKLGRSKVCSLYKEGVEILSDYQGVLYIPMDKEGAWKLTLAREFKEAGFTINGLP